jgi:hypothetical protein
MLWAALAAAFCFGGIARLLSCVSRYDQVSIFKSLLKIVGLGMERQTTNKVLGWTLEDCEERHRQWPDTFEIPDIEIRTSLERGDVAQLVFRITLDDDREPEVFERMWVEVKEATKSGYVGLLCNNSHSLEENDILWSGTAVAFQPNHIINAHRPENELDDASDDGIFFHRLIDAGTGYSLIIDDDGRVAYAYLLNAGREIVGDVWLYNRGPNPQEPEWTERPERPFQNPAGFATEQPFEPVSDPAELSVEWRRSTEGAVVADLLVRQQMFAVLAEGAKPGWSRLAVADGPLARVMEA